LCFCCVSPPPCPLLCSYYTKCHRLQRRTNPTDLHSGWHHDNTTTRHHGNWNPQHSNTATHRNPPPQHKPICGPRGTGHGARGNRAGQHTRGRTGTRGHVTRHTTTAHDHGKRPRPRHTTTATAPIRNHTPFTTHGWAGSRGTDRTRVIVGHRSRGTGHGAQTGHGSLLKDTCHRAQGTRHEARGTGHEARGTRHEARGTRYARCVAWQTRIKTRARGTRYARCVAWQTRIKTRARGTRYARNVAWQTRAQNTGAQGTRHGARGTRHEARPQCGLANTDQNTGAQGTNTGHRAQARTQGTRYARSVAWQTRIKTRIKTRGHGARGTRHEARPLCGLANTDQNTGAQGTGHRSRGTAHGARGTGGHGAQ